MPRYQMRTSDHGTGGFDEFTAASDEDAIEYARCHLYGATLRYLAEVVIGPTDRRREISLSTGKYVTEASTVGELSALLSGFPRGTPVSIAHHGMDGTCVRAHLDGGVVRLSDNGDC